MEKNQKKRPVMLVILDGWGYREERADNAVALAATPHFDRLWAECPHLLLDASGEAVGLPAGQMGNSEVGHLNIGAGRVVLQDLPRIDRALASGELERNAAFRDFVAAIGRSGGRCHLLGLVSPGGVHSHENHAIALARALDQAEVEVLVHALTDGRDTPPQGAAETLPRFLAALPPKARVVSVIGRYFAMDRDKRWDRVERAYRAIALGEGERAATPMEAVHRAHQAGVGDEFIPPTVIGAYDGAREGDGLLSFNFRADRVREILAALAAPDFDAFARPRPPAWAARLGMTEYSAELAPLFPALFPPETLENVLGAVVAKAGLRQLRIAETEKYAHVTYFLNGGREEPFPGEERILVPSPKVATYDLKPEMSAPEVTERVVAAIGSGAFDLIVLNYANPDMVGHTGKLEAAIAAVEAVDRGLGAVVQAIAAAGGALLVTADHGNCELMRDPATGGPHTAHTTNPVPALLFGVRAEAARARGRLADIAPTLLLLLGLPKPPQMTGEPLFVLR